MPHLPHVLRATARTVLPGWGARANARDAVEHDRRAALARRATALVQAHALGPGSWVPLDAGSCRAWPASGARHGVDVYADDAALLTQLTAYVADGLAEAHLCLVVATPVHRAGLVHRLALQGLVDRTGQLVLLDAQELLEGFLGDGWPDPALFDRTVGDLVRGRGDGARVRVFGEMVGLLQAAGDGAAAMQLEKLWASLQLELGFDLLCGCPAQALRDPDASAGVLARHSHVDAPLG